MARVLPIFALQGGCGSASTATAPASELVDVAVDLRAVMGRGWLCQPHTGNFVTCELAQLAPRGSSGLTMSRQAVRPGRLENLVEVAATAQTDTNVANNRATVAVEVE